MAEEYDDSFDIDIYGDDEPSNDTAEQVTESEQPIEAMQPIKDVDADARAREAVIDNLEAGPRTQQTPHPSIQPAKLESEPKPSAPADPSTLSTVLDPQSQPRPGLKRKASTEDNTPEKRRRSSTTHLPVDPNATPALKFADLNWWTTEEDLRSFCNRAGVENELTDLGFAEHKINGKSRGEAYMQFASPQAANAVKREIEKANEMAASAPVGKRTVFGVQFCAVGNPFKGASNAGPNKTFSQAGSNRGGGGGYERGYGGQRGSYGGRGNSGQNRGGGYGNNYNNMQSRQHPQQNPVNWNGNAAGAGMMNGNGIGGFAANPMMGMFQQMGNAMMGNGGGYGGGMGMGMNNMGIGMGGRRGGMMGVMNPGMGGMMGRGGWGGGFQGQ